jgi:hypothetical protein
MAFISGYVCGTAVVLFLLVFVVYGIHRGRSTTKSTDRSPDHYVDDLHNEAEQFLQNLAETFSSKPKKRR